MLFLICFQLSNIAERSLHMFNGSRFFNLARKWKEQDMSPMHFKILQAVMDHYFGCITGYCKKELLEIDNASYPVIAIAFVLDSVGYSNYSIERFEEIGKTLVYLRNTL